MIEDDCVENGVPLPNVNSRILAMVIEYCNKHAAASAAVGGTSSDNTAATSGEQDLESSDAKFIEAVDWNTLCEIILAANYLAIQGLLDLSSQRVAEIIKDETVEQVRKRFNIQNDFTPEEEAKVREENQWTFE
uniref:Uncharacterized protein n=1 Tax=Avena sativa TaxID=4498 RepID=A0ACD5Y6J1_AVESA